MRKITLLALALIASPASAEVDWEALADDKVEARQDMDALSCGEFKNELSEAADSVDSLRTVERNTNDYEMVIFGLALILKKAESCIQ